MTLPNGPVPSKVWPYLHALLLGFGAGATSFLQLVLGVGLPLTTSAWRGLLVGTIAAGLSRMFGVMLKKFGP